MYREFYRDEPFVRVVDAPPATKHARGNNMCLLYPTVDIRTDRLVVVSVIDNLVKGAAGQAIQNMNAMIGLPEPMDWTCRRYIRREGTEKWEMGKENQAGVDAGRERDNARGFTAGDPRGRPDGLDKLDVGSSPRKRRAWPRRRTPRTAYPGRRS